ncbi:MAG TPA: NADH-quinone oxidoreductase subunit H [Anaerolineaceae bacterium]|jgi:NADH-quinone oxidoreductase subunit H|nr:NADH-quinone oxidoreductase subunit H [Anaerolineaceae bacterium]
MSFIADPVNFIANWLTTVLTGWGASASLIQIILFVIGAGLLSLGPLLLTILLIWVERKIGGRFQDRLGPNRLGPWGIIQPIADMLKIFTKELITPTGADKVPYNLAPILAAGSVIAVWAVIPLASTVYGVNINIGAVYILAFGALGELGFIMAGLGSNNKFALLGGFRVVANLLSYEVPMILILLVPVMFSGSLGMNDIALSQTVWNVFLAPLAAIIFFITLIAENARAPFDLIEADSEIVAGFNVEYSGLKFGFFYVADFLHSVTAALVFSTLFLGGWRGPGAETYPILGFIYLVIKAAIIYFAILHIRFSIPRFRIDQMMSFNWKFLTPLSMMVLVTTALLNKLVPGDLTLVRVAVMWAANLVLWVAADQIVKRVVKKQAVPEVAQPRPLARPPQVGTNDILGG